MALKHAKYAVLLEGCATALQAGSPPDAVYLDGLTASRILTHSDAIAEVLENGEPPQILVEALGCEREPRLHVVAELRRLADAIEPQLPADAPQRRRPGRL